MQIVKTTNPEDYLELLEVFYIALTNSLIEKKQIIDWADQIILSDTVPDNFIIDLSLSGHKSTNDVLSLISEYIDREKLKVSGRVILGFLYNRYINKQIELKNVTSATSWLVWQTDLSDDEKGFMYALDDYYSLAEQGIYGSFELVESEMLQFMEIYKEFSIENFSEWKAIDKHIDKKIADLIEELKNKNPQNLSKPSKR